MSADYEQWKPHINLNLCTGCEQCVAVCPENVLLQVEDKAKVVRPENCTYCLACEDSCPQSAIELPFLIVTKAQYEKVTN
jgi:ferredoxin